MLLVSVILNAYTVTILSRRISKTKTELRRMRWKYDKVMYKRYSKWPAYLKEVLKEVE